MNPNGNESPDYDGILEEDVDELFATVIEQELRQDTQLDKQYISPNVQRILDITKLDDIQPFQEKLPSPTIIRYRSLKRRSETEDTTSIDVDHQIEEKRTNEISNPIQVEMESVVDSQQQMVPQHLQISNNEFLSAIEKLIDNKITKLKSEFLDELERVQQGNSVTKNIENLKPANIDIDNDDGIEEIRWLKKQCRYYRDECSYLKDALSLRDQEMDTMAKTIEILTKEKDDSANVIKKLNNDLQKLHETINSHNVINFQNQQQIDNRKQFIKYENEEHDGKQAPSMLSLSLSSVTRIPSVESPTEHDKPFLSNILNKMEILDHSLNHNHYLSTRNNNQDSLFVVPPLPRVNTSPSRILQPRRPASASSTMRRRTSFSSTNTVSSNIKHSITSQNQIQQLQQDSQIQHRLEHMAERIMKSLRGAPPADENYKEVDRMVEAIKSQFRDKGINLPLKKYKNSVYTLGHSEPFKRKLHLNVIGGELVVRLGGGFQSFLSVLDKALVRLSVQVKT